MQCIFCKIVKGDAPCYKVYEDSKFLAFLDIFPVVEGHTIVMPKQHYKWVWDVKESGEYMKVCQKIAKHFQKVTKNELVAGLIFGEEIPHAHFHLLPNMDGKTGEIVMNLSKYKGAMIGDKEAKATLAKLAIK
jgi:histidine triad (HIT) family protein